MANHFACSCGKRLQTKAELAGKRVRCPACGKQIIVPDAKTQSSQQADSYSATELTPDDIRKLVGGKSLFLVAWGWICFVLSGIASALFLFAVFAALEDRRGFGLAIGLLVFASLNCIYWNTFRKDPNNTLGLVLLPALLGIILAGIWLSTVMRREDDPVMAAFAFTLFGLVFSSVIYGPPLLVAYFRHR